MVYIFIEIVVFIIIFAIRQNYKEKKRQEELRKKRLLEEQKRKREEERRRKEEIERKRLEELNFESLTVVYETIDSNGKPKAIVKRNNNSYTSIERKTTPFSLGEILKLKKEKTKEWNWYNETEYQRRLERHRKTDLINQKILEEREKQNQYLNRFRIGYLYHMTHKDNLQSILENGLKSHNYAYDNNLTKNDISDNQVNDRRSKREPIFNKSIHDYVPLYFNPKNPMLS